MHNRCWKTQRFQWELAPSSDAFKEQKEKRTYFGCITLKENNMIIKDQNLGAETLNSYFSNVVDDLEIQPYTAFENQRHVSNIPKYWNHKQLDVSLTNHDLVKYALQKI